MNPLIKILFGPEVALAINFLRTAILILDSIQNGNNPNVAPFAKQVFSYLPSGIKAPVGPATEQEFTDALYNVFALFIKQKQS